MSALEILPAAAEPPASQLVLVPTAPGRPAAGEKDYIRGALWAAVAASAAWLGALPFASPALLPLILVTGGGLGFLGYLDHVTHRILDKHILIFGAGVLALLAATQGAFGTSALVPGLIGGAAGFAAMLLLSYLTSIGGGDIKLAPVPAAVLAVYSSAAVMTWLFFIFFFHLLWSVAVKVSGRPSAPVAGVPFMAAAFVATVAAIGLLGVAGL